MSEIDSLLSTINGLTWLPWIGNDYFKIPMNNRLFIVGESHYHNGTEEKIEEFKSITSTREILEELAIDRYYWGTKMFPNFHKVLFKNDDFNSSSLWNLVSFYNIVQRPMATIKERPNYDDFHDGWKVFFETIKIIKPKTCLFIGTSASNSFYNAIKDTGYFIHGTIECEDLINGAYPRKVVIKDKENNETKIIFIKHTSQMFSWNQWNGYLKRVIPSELAFLESKIEYPKILDKTYI